jgi:hypothetical protein
MKLFFVLLLMWISGILVGLGIGLSNGKWLIIIGIIIAHINAFFIDDVYEKLRKLKGF